MFAHLYRDSIAVAKRAMTSNQGAQSAVFKDYLPLVLDRKLKKTSPRRLAEGTLSLKARNKNARRGRLRTSFGQALTKHNDCAEIATNVPRRQLSTIGPAAELVWHRMACSCTQK